MPTYTSLDALVSDLKSVVTEPAEYLRDAPPIMSAAFCLACSERLRDCYLGFVQMEDLPHGGALDAILGEIWSMISRGAINADRLDQIATLCESELQVDSGDYLGFLARAVETCVVHLLYSIDCLQNITHTEVTNCGMNALEVTMEYLNLVAASDEVRNCSLETYLRYMSWVSEAPLFKAERQFLQTLYGVTRSHRDASEQFVTAIRSVVASGGIDPFGRNMIKTA